MDFKPDPRLAGFREEVRDFLREKLPPELTDIPCEVVSPRPVAMRWQKILQERGWAAPGWAKQHGGTGWTVQQQLVFEEECVLAGAPLQDSFAQKLLGPVLNHFASPEQWQEHVPPILAGERLWCQGFSEPGSGSDLASLRTAAVRQGDSYVVNGQKIWTTNAHNADWIFLLVRTDGEVRPQAGISFLLVDLRSPGITVRPIHSIDGEHHLNEVFFDEVRVPASNRIGEEGMGWSITKFLLNNEHATAADPGALKKFRRQIAEVLTEPAVGGERLIDRGEHAVRFAALDAELTGVLMMIERTAALHGDTGHFAHALGSMLKVRATDLQQRMSLYLSELHGAGALVAGPVVGSAARRATQEMFFRRGSTIYGGSSEVQRGIVAKLLFGF